MSERLWQQEAWLRWCVVLEANALRILFVSTNVAQPPNGMRARNPWLVSSAQNLNMIHRKPQKDHAENHV